MLGAMWSMTESESEHESEGHGTLVENGSEPGDEALMGQVAEGNHGAFAQLVRRHTPRMYAVARRIAGRPEEAEEAVQDAFLRVWVHATRWAPEKGSFAVWLARIVVNLCIDRRRADRYESLEDEETLVYGGEDVVAQLSRRQLADRMAAAVGQLPLRQRTALALCYYEGFTNAEAAAILDCTVGALEALLIRARRSLRDRLAPFDT